MIAKLLSHFREPLETDLDEAADFFREQKQEELETADNEFQELKERLQDDLGELEKSLEDIKGYSDHGDRAIVEDVVDNIVEDREKLVDGFEIVEDHEQLEEELEDFIEDFDDLSQKEAAVMKEANLKEEIGGSVKDIQELRDDLEDFINNRYQARQTLEHLEELMDRREELSLEIDEKQLELQDIDPGKIEEKIQETKEEIEDLQDSDRWGEYERLQEECKDLESRKEGLEAELNKAVSKMERGMKKLVYEIENGDLEFDGDLSILEDIRDGNTEELMENPGKTVEVAEDATGVLPPELLDRSVHRKFMDGAEFLLELEGHHQELFEVGNRIKELEEKIENHPAVDREEELERKKEELEGELEELQEKRERMEKEVENSKEELESIEQEIKDTVRSSFGREVVFRAKD